MNKVDIMPSGLISRFVLGSIIAVAILFTLVSPARAQSPVIAEVDRTNLSTGETLTLSIMINGSDAGAPQMPMLDGFQVVNSGKSSQLSVINGVISAQISYRYVLAPTREGTLTIPEISVLVDGQIHATQPITIQVTTGAAPLQPVQPIQPSAQANPNPPASQGLTGQDYYVEASVDNPSPYVGEQVIHTFRFYRSRDNFGLDQPSYKAPGFGSFWTEGETQQYDYDVQAASRIYRVVELKTLLFPTSAGEQIIEPSTLTIPGSFFSAGTRLATDPITVNVRPTPHPASDGFRGAVGQFTISTSVDNDHVAVNEPLTLQIVVAGDGNISTIPDPEMPILDGWRAFEAASTINTGTSDGSVSGSRVTEQLLVPGSAGDFTIPPIHYTYFDPASDSYQTVSSTPISVIVAESAGGAAALAPGSQLPGDGDVPVVGQVHNIRHIKPVPVVLDEGVKLLVYSPLYWLLWLVPLGALVLDEYLGRRKRYMADNPDLVRSSNAAKKARRQLAKARQDQDDPYAAIGGVLDSYLSERFNQPVAGMTHKRLGEFLQESGVPPSHIMRIADLILWTEMGRYGAVDVHANSIAEMFDRTDQLIIGLEKVMPRAN